MSPLHQLTGGAALSHRVKSAIEPMIKPDENRFTLFPIKQKRMWEMYKRHVASFWTVSSNSYRLSTRKGLCLPSVSYSLLLTNRSRKLT